MMMTTRMHWVLFALTMLLATLSMAHPTMTARHPTRRSIDYELIKRATEHDPEKWALEHNGALPNGTMNKSGYALDCTYPQSVSKALSGATARTADGVVNATAKQVQDLEWYMALCTNVYCPNVIVNDVWDCPYCNQTDDLAIIKTFNTKKEDTNVLVARGDKEKGIFIAFRGSGSTKNWIAVSCLLEKHGMVISHFPWWIRTWILSLWIILQLMGLKYTKVCKLIYIHTHVQKV